MKNRFWAANILLAVVGILGTNAVSALAVPPSTEEVSNSLCSGTAATQATCPAQWVAVGNCDPPAPNCGTGVGTATDCSCDETNHDGVGADCYCNAS